MTVHARTAVSRACLPRISSLLLLLTAVCHGLPALAAPHMISGGSGHVQVLDGDGSVWVWGYNKYGTVGDGSTIEATPNAQTTPRKASLSGVVAIASGQGASFAVTQEGAVWSWGYGYLGLGAYEGKTVPTQVAGLSNVRQLASGLYHTLALKRDGTLVAWGNNSRGAVGDGSTTHRALPVTLALSDIKVIAANGHSLAVKNDGTVWAWGENNRGQAGGVAGQHPNTPTQIAGLSDVKAIAAGVLHSVALKNDGTVWSWGAGVARGDGTLTDTAVPVRASIDRVIAIAAGDSFTLALKDDGTVWTFGVNAYTPSGSTALPLPQQVDGLTGVRSIGAAFSHRVVILADGSVRSWGMNDVGQLGNGQAGGYVNTPAAVVGASTGTLSLQPASDPKANVDRLFNWAESAFPALFTPHVSSGYIEHYYVRCYSTGNCLGEEAGKVYLYDGSLTEVGTVSQLLNTYAIPAGF